MPQNTDTATEQAVHSHKKVSCSNYVPRFGNNDSSLRFMASVQVNI